MPVTIQSGSAPSGERSSPSMSIMPVSEIMTADVVTADESYTLDQCLKLMSQHNIRHLPVVDRRTVVGVLGIGELVNDFSDA